MSITFWLEKHTATIQEENPYFEKNEPEDPVYNPRMHSVDIYPTLSASNINAISLLRSLHLEACFQDKDGYHGRIPKMIIPEVLEMVIKTKDLFILNYGQVLKTLLRSAIALDDNIIWG